MGGNLNGLKYQLGTTNVIAPSGNPWRSVFVDDRYVSMRLLFFADAEVQYRF